MTAGTVPVRDEDSFDVDSFHQWVLANAPAIAVGAEGPPAIDQFPGGASNLTYLVHYPAADVVLRRPPAGHKAASAHDMGREVNVQTRLRPLYPLVPKIHG
ncbi:MAG: phosphotransferase, partial [bacterium]|nr:phosphotransferase [bacterium]